jgi:ABC-type transport system involved in cytochrome c biogenesis ATPase subunit/GNAT superfamily N-acetyltransferase
MATAKQAPEYFRLIKARAIWDRVLEQYRIDIRFEATTEVTPRTVEVAEAFGLGVDTTQQFTIYENLSLEINKGDIVYITGDSGSGKSVLLRWLTDALGEEAVYLEDLEVDVDQPLIDTVGKTTREGLELLSRVGLNDAFIFLRKYSELSDGQRYRYRLAKVIETGRPFWVMDEFCATLDRDTAKIVAYNVQKLARRLGHGLLAATTHTDLGEDLHPSVAVHKRFGADVAVTYAENTPAPVCSVLEQMGVTEGTYEEWKQVAGFHYRSHRVAFRDKIFILRKGDEICGAIVYVRPTVSCAGRSRVFKPKDMRELNAKLTRIARVVVRPKYRTIGAGVKLVRETLPRCGKPMVETVAVMAKYNPFFERAGMTKVQETTPGPEITDFVDGLEGLGFKAYLLSVESYNYAQLEGKVAEVKALLGKVRFPYNRRISRQSGTFTKKRWAAWLQQATREDLADALTVVAQLNQTKAYLFWKRL